MQTVVAAAWPNLVVCLSHPPRPPYKFPYLFSCVLHGDCLGTLSRHWSTFVLATGWHCDGFDRRRAHTYEKQQENGVLKNYMRSKKQRRQPSFCIFAFSWARLPNAMALLQLAVSLANESLVTGGPKALAEYAARSGLISLLSKRGLHSTSTASSPQYGMCMVVNNIVRIKHVRP